MNDIATHLIVYGTLRTGFANPAAIQLHQRSRYVGDGTFPGLLYDVGAYPGAILQPGAQTLVHGSIYELVPPAEPLIHLLDEYEGLTLTPVPSQPDEYIRRTVPINQGEIIIPCWVYLYNWPVDLMQPIPSGDYVTYLSHKQKKYRP